jgi:hypothetical protein
MAAEANAAPIVNEPHGANLVSTGANTPASPAEGATTEATHALTPRIERGIERFRAADTDGIGLTREQMAKNFPHLADRFDVIDTDHDGRVEASELIAALPHMTQQAREAQ